MRTLSPTGNSATSRDDLAARLNAQRDSSKSTQDELVTPRPRPREVILISQKPDELPLEERIFSRRGVMKTAMAGAALFTLSVLEPLFKIAEANDKVPGEHHFTPQNIAKLNIDTTSQLLDLAQKRGYLPAETANSKFSSSKFVDIADRASLHEVRQYFRAIEMLRNDGFFDDDKADVQNIVSGTPAIAPVRSLLLGTLGARAKDGSEVVHGMTRGELFYVLNDYLPNNFQFPYKDDRRSTAMLNKFNEGIDRIGNASIQNRGLGSKHDAIIAANKRK
ncbi:MAG: hypothetical protein HOA17_09100 [Candidatus Melainabacteria bacterium]|jgi:hypothetical protein|nr:hypothetical protein [Candidatus Melainabacteria bacterium]